MKILVRILAALLLVATLVCLVACGGSDDKQETQKETQTSGEKETDSRYDEWGREKIPSPLEGKNVNFADKTVVLLTRNDERDFYSEDMNGEVINDVIYERNGQIHEELNVNIEINEKQYDQILSATTAARLAGTNDFDVVANYAYFATTSAQAQNFKNLKDIPSIHLDAVYWNQNYNKAQTINGKQYFFIGSMNLKVIDRTLATFFNRRLAEDYDFGNLYETVLDGKWTIETMTELTADSWNDLNSNDKMDAEDYFGLCTTEGYGGWYTACDLMFVSTTEDGHHELDLDVERAADAIDQLIDMFKKNNGAWVGDFGGSDVPVGIFTSGNCAFLVNNVFRNSEFNAQIRNMNDQYGLIPMPKYDEFQDGYHGWIQDAYSVMSIMDTVTEEEMVGTVIDYMSYLSYEKIYPLYTENVIKFKYLCDSESGQCFDLIVNGLKFDIGELYGFEIGQMAHGMCRDIINSGSNTVASKYDSNAERWNENLKKIDDFYFDE